MKKANPASIRASLLNFAQKEGVVFQFIIIRYLHERLLYRLSVSEYVSKFFLKGGALLYAFKGIHVRPTMDIDMSARQVQNDKETIKEIFQHICQINYEDDCVYFEADSIVATDITEESKYSGIRLLINARFDSIRQRLQIDIGFGDIIIPSPITLTYPTLLSGLASPEIKAYSVETVIAEKFQAMIALGTFNSRMKDFFDVYILLKSDKVNREYLQEAIIQTFKQRHTSYIENHELFSESFHKDPNRQMMWNAFMKKIRGHDFLSFETVMVLINSILQPIYENLRRQ
ncbi:MAG: nucleotidyl transferase AbiEii/AbiGii toxin family protein [Prevotellaceae bacterium]|jgi:predicted nucleotidyltransferase component of viral defense system|nr:nucleotidyl transferase AbiEii/AbiGii toxin family protein [Prevotellaceae bacterium]